MNDEDRIIRSALEPILRAPVPGVPLLREAQPERRGLPVAALVAAAGMLVLLTLILVSGPTDEIETPGNQQLSERIVVVEDRILLIEDAELQRLLRREVELLRRELELAREIAQDR